MDAHDLSVYIGYSTVILFVPVIIDRLSIAYHVRRDQFFNRLSFSNGKPCLLWHKLHLLGLFVDWVDNIMKLVVGFTI